MRLGSSGSGFLIRATNDTIIDIGSPTVNDVHFQLLEVAPGALDQHSAPFVARCEGQCVRVAVGILGADLHVSPIEDLLPAELGGQLLLLVVLRVAFEALGWSSVESHSLDGVRKLGVVAGARRCGYSCGATEQQC